MLSAKLSAQNITSRLIQLNATVDILGNISILSIEEPKSKIDRSDTLINYEIIKKIIRKYRKSIDIFNELTVKGWILVTSVYVSKDDNGRPNSPLLIYYFKKEFVQ